jgi:hypothetical protein
MASLGQRRDIHFRQKQAFQELWVALFPKNAAPRPLFKDQLDRFKGRLLALPNSGGAGCGLESLISGPQIAVTREDSVSRGVRLPEHTVRQSAGVHFVPNNSVNFMLEEWIKQFNEINHQTNLL